MTGETEKVVMGAGKWYVAPYTSGAIDFDTLCVEDNLMGYTKGGATITFTPTTYTIEDDIGMVRKTFQTKGDAEMKTGLLTFTIRSLAALLSVGAVTEKAATISATGLVTLKLSGGKTALKRYFVAFVYQDDETGLKTFVGMVATNIAPLVLAFMKDSETVVDMTFNGESNGVDDTMLTIAEETAKTAA